MKMLMALPSGSDIDLVKVWMEANFSSRVRRWPSPLAHQEESNFVWSQTVAGLIAVSILSAN
jgi:hypothetical protein